MAKNKTKIYIDIESAEHIAELYMRDIYLDFKCGKSVNIDGYINLMKLCMEEGSVKRSENSDDRDN